MSTLPEGPRSSRDFYAELIKGSQSKAAGFLAERERWLRSVEVDGREELLFEFEMLLRGVERYFNLHNLPLDASRPVVTRSFHEELVDVHDAIDQSIRLARQLLDQDSDQKMVFRKYVESQLADDRVRRELIESELDQDSPQESLFVLRQSFDALRTIVDHLLRLPICSYNLFCDVGNLALRDVVLNRYFRPFRPLEFRIEYDRIKSVPVLGALSALEEPERRLFTVAFLACFRILHYLSYVSTEAGASPERRCRVVLALARSEAITLAGYLTGELAPKATAKRHKGVALKAAREITRESGRLAKKLAEDLDDEGAALLEAAVGLTALFRRQIETLATAIEPRLCGEALFDRLVSRSDCALRLRRDLWVLATLCKDAEAALRRPEPDGVEPTLAAVRRYLGYFYDVSYQLLRYGDYEAFDRFAAMVLEQGQAPAGPVARARLAEDCRMFSQVAETTFAAVNRRTDLAERRFEAAEAKG
ncbi:MAG: hypothetical protein ACYC8T_33160, partial [Myxococcaceae bacterium]